MSGYERWRLHFIENRDRAPSLPWEDPYRLDEGERGLVERSLQQFQLGEFARGRGLRRRAAAAEALAGDGDFLPALELFIAEEQGHSGMLGRFMERERIPCLRKHWVDVVFRRVRKLAGLELCVMALVTAEVLAIPFYRALRDATRSPLLRAICGRILCDEAAHLGYQAMTLGLIRRAAGRRARSARSAMHAVLFHGTALVLWQQHAAVFRAAGWNFRSFWADSHRGFERLQNRIGQVACARRSLDEMRLD